MKGPMSQDEKLNSVIAGCKKKQPQCFERLVDMYASRCYGYFYRLSGNADTAGDLLNELFLKVYQKIGSYRGESFNGWIFRIAANLFSDYIRQKVRYKKLLDEKQAQQTYADSDPPRREHFAADKLDLCLSRLEPELAELITLRFYSQMSFKELAKLRREPIGTTLSKVHRGLNRLRELMENENKNEKR